MIVEKLNEDGTKVYKYQEPYRKEKFTYFQELSEIFYDYLESLNMDRDRVILDYKLVNEIFIRIDKRKDYFIIYHDETHVNEVREAALLAYWVLKFKPFLIKAKEQEDYNKDINCGFAVFVVLSAVTECLKRKFGEKTELHLSETYIEKMKYAFKFWDISKEAMMFIAETLNEHAMEVVGEK